MRPNPLSRIRGASARVRRMPLMTFVSNALCQSPSLISNASLGSNQPALFTRMSTAPAAAMMSSMPFAVATSPGAA